MDDAAALRSLAYFIRYIWRQTPTDRLANLGSDIEPIADGGPTDPGMAQEWRSVRVRVTSLTDYPSGLAYLAAIEFVKFYAAELGWSDKEEFLERIKARPEGGPADPTLARFWVKAIAYEQALSARVAAQSKEGT